VRLLAGPEEVTDPEKALACRGSTKFGESPTREEMVSLLQEWAATEFGEVCPHGKPITKRVTLADLLREFGRVYTISQNY
jgi:DNA mismatch repair protein MutL